jgi:hypothetical protein
LDLLFAPARTAAKKVVDKIGGVLVGSSEFHESTWLSQSIGVCESKYACPTKKGEGKNMTKRNLLLVSLFLVFGLATMASSALAQNMQWLTGSSASYAGRAEGLDEETGYYSLTNNVPGTVTALNYFTLVYNLPVITNSVHIVCTGADFPGGCSATGAPYFTIAVGSGGYTVTLTFAETVPFGTTKDLVEVYVRVNAAAAGVGCAAPFHGSWPSSGPGVVTAYATATTVGTSTTGISITGTNANNTYPVLYVNCEPALSLGFTPRDKSIGATGWPAQVLPCLGVTSLGPYDNKFCINVDEEFAGALTSASWEYTSDPDATNGTNLVLVLTDVPVGISLGTPVLSYPAGNTFALGTLTGAPYCTPDAGSSPPTDTCTYTWPVVNEDNGSVASVNICFTMTSRGPICEGYVEIYANVYKGPTKPCGSSIPCFTGVLEGPAPQPASGPYNLSVVDFSECQTVLLFPYVTNAAGFDTGIAVSNTTLDPFRSPPPVSGFPNFIPTYWKGGAWPQSGTCYFYLYSGGALAGTYSTSTIGYGNTVAFDLGYFGVSSVSGYVIAVCMFQNAHAYAFISTASATGIASSADYLADVLPDPAFYHRSPAGNFYGETAITPGFGAGPPVIVP